MIYKYKKLLTENSDTEIDREGIIIRRLAYLRWVLDNLKDNKQYVKIQNMYNALDNITFNASGEVRSLGDTIEYIHQSLLDNDGEIPGMPTEEQIEEIDKKANDLESLHPDVFDAYIKRLEKANLDKKTKDQSDQADQILHPKKDESDEKLKEKIADMTSIFGFTNIIGLENDLKPSEKDIKAKEELKKAKEDNSLLSIQSEEDDVAAEEEKDNEEPSEEAPEEEPKEEPKKESSDEDLTKKYADLFK